MKLLTSLLLGSILLLSAGVQVQAADPATQKISQREMEQVLKSFLVKQSARLPGVELHFSSLTLPTEFEIPKGRVEQQVIPANPGVIGSRHLTLLTRVDGQVVSNLSIPVELTALAKVVVAAADLQRGDLLSPDNVSQVAMDITRLKQPILNPDDVYGKQLKRSLRLGQALQRNLVDFPPVVKRGDRVEIQLQHGALLLSAVGEARQDGQEGDTIRVLNSDSHREVLCQVQAPGRVSVEF